MRLIHSLPLLLSIAFACGDKASDDSGAADGTDAADGADGTDGDHGHTAVCTEPTDVACVDALILDLSLHDDKVSDGDVSTTTEGEDFVTVVDATAGGYNQAANNPWTYIKFTESGAERVDLDDESALESMDWDMSLRRFILRLNGGSSGPSCVGAAALLESDYEAVTEVPDGIRFAVDDYYTDSCEIINDSSGLPNSPQVSMGAWWSYSACVKTTSVPHLIQLADGHIIKVRVETYYATGQDDCNDRDQPGGESGIITLRWRYLP